MRRKDMMPFAPKEYYPLHPDVKKILLATETEEEIEAYFKHLAKSVKSGVCAECGQVVDFSYGYKQEHIKEYGISALCVECQIKTFGA